MKRFRCGDVVPGCDAVFEGSHEEVVAAMIHHATEDHGITEITPELLAAAESRIVSVV